MLIDATHPEETRVVVVDGARIEEFDYESVTKQQIAGNIYLAKVTRVEPSLQAAFVDYGGNRHGFLAFAEIHPDYYQIPRADREALLAAERAAEEEDEEAAEEEVRAPKHRNGKRNGKRRGDRHERNGRPRRGDSRNRKDRIGVRSLSDQESPLPERLLAAADTAQMNGRLFNHPDLAALTADVVLEDEAAAHTAEPVVEAEGPQAPRLTADQTTDPYAEATPNTVEASPLEDVSEIQIRRKASAEEASALGSDTIVDTYQIDANGALNGPAPAAATEAEKTEAILAERAHSSEAIGGEPADYQSSEEQEHTPDHSEAAEDTQPDGNDAPNMVDSLSAEEFAAAETDGEDGEDDTDEDGAESIESEVEEIGGEDAREEIRPRRIRMRDFKIQEVIKKRQILLVQVVKEERGTKGAALTTYLSLAGRYCVLMPNTARGGGISRKITNAADRKRLKSLAQELEVPEGMGLIVRTAGANRTKAEIKRDYEYLLRQWEAVRGLTLRSIAPEVIYEEGSLIKRAIRDLYNKDTDAVVVEGEEGYREAKDYMKMLMPSHAKNVQAYRDITPLFIRHQVESQMAAMMNPTVQLKSGGYIVIGVTEALVAVDVNSGRSTKEGSIEDTALKTNLEAAEEVARQLKLRDLAGLIVIDFIDMEEARNNRAVEKRLKDKLKTDRARIQLGRISAFGLLEMSRQRLRPGLLEATTKPCRHCKGSGVVRSDESLALTILRAIEEEGVRGRSAAVKVTTPVDVANYLLNQKRSRIAQVEERYRMQVHVIGDPSLVSPDFSIDRIKPMERDEADNSRAAIQIESGFSPQELEPPAEAGPEDEPEMDRAAPSTRRRKRRRDKDEDGEAVVEAAQTEPAEVLEDENREEEWAAEADSDDDDAGKKRRGKRGGRRRRKRSDRDSAANDPLPVIEFTDGDADDTGQPAQAAKKSSSNAAKGPQEAVAVKETVSEYNGPGTGPKQDDRRDGGGPGALTAPDMETPEMETPEMQASGPSPSDPEAMAVRESVSQEPLDPPPPPQEPPLRRRTGWWNFRGGA